MKRGESGCCEYAGEHCLECGANDAPDVPDCTACEPTFVVDLRVGGELLGQCMPAAWCVGETSARLSEAGCIRAVVGPNADIGTAAIVGITLAGVVLVASAAVGALFAVRGKRAEAALKARDEAGKAGNTLRPLIQENAGAC